MPLGGGERCVVKVLIMGCGRVGAELAAMLDQEGHEVTVLDRSPDAFRRLPTKFGGHCVVGNGIDQEVLARIGVAEMDAFVSVTQGDNRNVMAAQMAKHLFGVQRVVCRIYDPIREELYHELGLETISPTKVGARLLKEALEREPAASGSGD
ncbi:MAG: TrkA family potassium uptake protein [Dehalococcoidia bacterium]|nr:TrkA family potassium uptake protein [Dehalococcoidia bacterium]